MAKITITENKLKQIINESVKRILKEFNNINNLGDLLLSAIKNNGGKGIKISRGLFYDKEPREEVCVQCSTGKGYGPSSYYIDDEKLNEKLYLHFDEKYRNKIIGFVYNDQKNCYLPKFDPETQKKWELEDEKYFSDAAKFFDRWGTGLD